MRAWARSPTALSRARSHCDTAFISSRRSSPAGSCSRTVSRERTARDLQRSNYILDAVPKLIAADSGFPSWYAAVFRDRWRFAACRLALQADPIDRAVVLELGAGSTADKAKFESILALLPRRAARLVILAWLWYRLRPTSLTALLRTMLAMRGLRLTFGFRSGRIPGMTAATAAPGDA